MNVHLVLVRHRHEVEVDSAWTFRRDAESRVADLKHSGLDATVDSFPVDVQARN